LIKQIESSKCRRYMGRVVRNIKIDLSPKWMVKHLESIGQRSINNIVDATNIVMYDCGQPVHVFDLNKVKGLKLTVRNAKDGEKIVLLDGKEKILNQTMMVISDDAGNSLDIAGVKGGRYAELTQDTVDIILEVANFDPISVRKTAQALNIVTDAKKRFENDLSPELNAYAMRELSALILEMCPEAIFEDIVDIYPKKQEEKKLSFSVNRISSMLGLNISINEIRDILGRYNFAYTENEKVFEIIVSPMRLDLRIEEDMAEEIGRILGYDKVKENMPKINFKPKTSETYTKIFFARNKLLNDGYSEVMTYVFRDKGEVEVLASASDKKHLRTSLSDGLKESLKLNQLNLPLFNIKEVKIFEIGNVFLKDREEIHVAYGNKKEIKEISLDEFYRSTSLNAFTQVLGSSVQDFLKEQTQPDYSQKHTSSAYSKTVHSQIFKPWSLFPFIARDIAVWVPEGIERDQIYRVIEKNAGDMVVRGPELFDEFKKDGKISYAFKLVFQSYEKTLKDEEVNEIMNKITNKIKDKNGWQVR